MYPRLSVYAMTKRRRCLDCGSLLLRISVGKTDCNSKGHRVHKHIAIGFVCVNCGIVDLDPNIKERIKQ